MPANQDRRFGHHSLSGLRYLHVQLLAAPEPPPPVRCFPLSDLLARSENSVVPILRTYRVTAPDWCRLQRNPPAPFGTGDVRRALATTLVPQLELGPQRREGPRVVLMRASKHCRGP